MRSIRGWAAWFVLCLLLAACGKPPPAQEPPAGEPLTIQVLLSPEATIRREAIEEAARAYRRTHPDIKVEVRQLTWGDLQGQGTAGDILVADRRTIGLLADEIRDFPAVRLPDLNDYVAGVYEDLMVQYGRRLGVPVHIWPDYFRISQYLFDDHGVEVPPADWTVDDWDRTFADFGPVAQLAPIRLHLLLEPVVRAYGGELPHADTGVDSLLLAETQQALAWLARQTEAGILSLDRPGTRSNLDVPPFNSVSSGLPPMGGASRPLPRGPYGRYVPVDATLAALLAASEHPEHGLAFVRELIGNTEL